MKRLAAATGALLLVMAPAAHAAPPPDLTYVPAPELSPFFEKAFGDKFKVAGVPQVMAPDESVILFNNYLRPVLSVPVAFKRTARLEQDVTIPYANDDGTAPEIMRKGMTLYHAVFQRDAAESRPIEAWCGTILWTLRHHDRYFSRCLVRTPDGKAVAYSGDGSNAHDGISESETFENVKSFPTAPAWFAFGLDAHPSLPFDYPALTETNMPSPDMAIVLRFDRGYRDKTSGRNYLIGAWALRGPMGATPTTGTLHTLVLPVEDEKVVVPMYDHQLEMAYTPEGVTLRFAKLTARDVPPVMASPVTDAPKTPPPPIIDEPWLFGSMALDPATVTIKSTPMKPGDIFLTASGHLSLRYRVKAEAQAGVDHFDAGTWIYRSEYTGYEANGEKYKIAAWCGPGERRAILHYKFILCVPTREGAHGLFFSRDWELVGFMKNPQFYTDYVPLDLEPNPDPAPETRQFQMRMDKVNAKEIRLSLGLLTGDRFVMQDRYDIPLDAHGAAKLYLWDRVVEFTAVDGQVVAKVLPGSGFGPRYARDLSPLSGGY